MDSWVIVQTFINPQEAYMAKAFLESAGIETRMQDEPGKFRKNSNKRIDF